MNKQRILWFQDSAKLRTDPRDWGRLDVLTRRLIQRVGHPDFENLIVDPISHLQALQGELSTRSFSTIIDLSGQMQRQLVDIFPQTTIRGDLHLSRVRVVSSPRVDGIGHFVSLGTRQIQSLRESLDLSQTLFLDDVGWSGRTMIDAARLLGVDMEKATFAFITANMGNFGPDRPGGTRMLEQAGAQVLAGSMVQTPQDDGFHLVDFFDHPGLGRTEVFDLIIHLQSLRERLVIADETSKQSIEREIKDILTVQRETLFPKAIGTQEMKMLQSEGKVVAQNGLNKNSFFDRNIPNWLMPSFSRRVRQQQLREHKTEICETIRELQEVSREQEVSHETRLDFVGENGRLKRERM